MGGRSTGTYTCGECHQPILTKGWGAHSQPYNAKCIREARIYEQGYEAAMDEIKERIFGGDEDE